MKDDLVDGGRLVSHQVSEPGNGWHNDQSKAWPMVRRTCHPLRPNCQATIMISSGRAGRHDHGKGGISSLSALQSTMPYHGQAVLKRVRQGNHPMAGEVLS